MDIRTAIITTDFMKDFVNGIIRDFFREEDFLIYPYQSFSDLDAIYRGIPESVRGVVTSGTFPAQVLRLLFPDTTRIIRAFNNDTASLYKLFFHLLHSNRDLRIERVYADVLDMDGISPEEFLLSPLERTVTETQVEAATRMDIDALVEIERKTAKKHIDKWNSGEIDVSITRFSSIMKRLRDENLNVYFAFPSRHYVKEIIQSTIQDVTISNLNDEMSGVLFVTVKTKRGESLGEEGRKKKELGAALGAFCSYYQLDSIIQEKTRGFEIVTNRKALALITEKFKTCKLQDYLSSRLTFRVDVGYGLGASLYQARINARDANGEASALPSGASCLIDENGILTAPLRQESALVVSRSETAAVRNLAKATGLSPLNIHKLVSAVSSSPDRCITSQELSYKLYITRRSANRLLKALKKSGQAVVVRQKRDTSFGRPENVYRIDLSDALIGAAGNEALHG